MGSQGEMERIRVNFLGSLEFVFWGLSFSGLLVGVVGVLIWCLVRDLGVCP